MINKLRKLWRTPDQDQSLWAFISLAFTVVIAMEYSTQSQFVFGYLYTGPILLANYSRNSRMILQVTVAAIALTLLNLFIPNIELHNPATIVNRLIAVMALAVTGWLSDRLRRFEKVVARSQAQLRTQKQLSIMREDFVSTLTHDLKTPLLGAIETINAFKTGQFGEVTPTQIKVLEMMALSHQSSIQLLQTLLDVYRNDSEGIQLQCQPVDLVAIASDIIATLTDLATSRQVYVKLHFGESDFPSHLWVNGDQLQLKRVFTNLIVNGINHSPRGGKVEVKLEANGSDHRVKIIDQGSGILSEELPHLFERFYQGSSDRQAKGSGLGLYLARQIITAHGGAIWAENRQPQGAIFGFHLPTISPPT